MSDYTVVRGPRSGDPHPRLRLAALTAVITGVLLVAAAAFLLSYTGIHQIALLAGVSPTLARLYPVMFDAMLVIACAAALALRSAGWPTRLYVWLSLLVLLGAVAAGDALYAMAISLPVQPTQAVVAIIPWVLLLMGFVMWLLMLRYWRRFRAAAAYAAAGAGGGAAAAANVRWAGGRGGAGAAVGGRTGAAAAPMRAAAPRAAIDTLLEPRPQRQTGRTASSASRPAAKDDAATGTYPEKKNDRAGNGGQGGNGGTAQRAGRTRNGGTAQRAGQTGNGGQTQGASQTQGAEQAEDGGEAGNAGQAHDPGHAHEQDQDMYDDGTRTGLTYEAPESLSPETPSAGAPSPETPSAGAPSPETPSAGAPPPETPSAGAPPPETPSAGAPPPETPSAGAPPPGAPASGAEPSETGTPADATRPEAGSGSYQPGTGGPGQTGDQASAPPMAPVPTPVPHFDRMRSTPTPPQDPEADEE